MRFAVPASILFFSLQAAAAVSFRMSRPATPTNSFVEITVTSKPAIQNPFTIFGLRGRLRTPEGRDLTIDGFCDSPDGSIHRIRFLATAPGHYTYELSFDNGVERATYAGTFEATPSGTKGLLRVDPDYPMHFLWSGTGEHYFWNGLTTYALLGWADEDYIKAIIDRAASYEVNRLRVTLVGPRVADASRWYEPVRPSSAFQFLYGPWLADQQDNISDPRWDVTRFDTAFFQKVERVLAAARARDTIISIVFFLDGEDPGADPFGKARMFSEDAKRYYRYVNARLGAFSNVTWDITNEWHLFRNAWWVEQMGSYLKSLDPYQHLVSTHGRGEFPWAVSQWPDFALYQIWDESGGYEPMLKRRLTQIATGHPIPQINEEYGYEDTYPEKWGGNRRPPSRNADSRRRLAWEITMAGCYQTTGEKASRNGDGKAPATPGGWINGGFDDSMHMLEGYKYLVEFFKRIPYWKLEPIAARDDQAARVLAENETRYVVYLPNGGMALIPISEGIYSVSRYDPRNGNFTKLPDFQGKAWRTPDEVLGLDFAYLLERR